jgi:ArsR family transcriptional regulator, lead/cadmium/zinc/bismuth-responsive transcriptional repressor
MPERTTALSHAADPGCRPEDHGAQREPVAVSGDAVERAARFFRALGEPSRLRLLVFLTRGEACVSEVAAAEGDEISTVSQRLRVLRSEGLVSRRRQGKHIVYRLADQHVVDMIFNALEHAAEPRGAMAATRTKGVTAYASHNSHR